MSPRLTKRASAVKNRRRSRQRHNEFGISDAAYPDGRIAVLLSRYPELSGTDFNEVLEYIRKARPSHLRRLRSSELVRTKLDRFLVDQRELLTTPRERFTWTAVAILTILLMCWFFWNKRPHPLSPRTPVVQTDGSSSGFAMTSHREARGNP